MSSSVWTPRSRPIGRSESNRDAGCGEEDAPADEGAHRYLAEFDFRYNNRFGLGVEDTERARKAVAGVAGKRLAYNQPHSSVAN